MPYVQLRNLGFAPRSLGETEHFSADVYGYLTADPNLHVWGHILRASPKAEGALFPGLTIVTLAAIAVVVEWRRARRVGDGRPLHSRLPLIPVVVQRSVGWLLAAAAVVLVAVLFGWSLRLPFLKITSLDRVFIAIIALTGALLAIAPRARVTARNWLGSPVGIFTALTLFAVVMSFGPHIDARGKTIEERNLYGAFYAFVPGFDGLRVPARFGMIVALGLAALAAYGVAALDQLRHATRVTAVLGALIFVESLAIPIGLNGNSTDYKQSGLTPLPDSVGTGDAIPPVYRFVSQLPQDAALVELPFGEVAFEVRYMYYSTAHWRPLVNGYSGGAPTEYGLLAENLKDVFRLPDAAWTALSLSGATHAIVHEGSYADHRGATVSDWMRRHGARELFSTGTDRVFALPKAESR
jgi:hypothetical protein